MSERSSPKTLWLLSSSGWTPGFSSGESKVTRHPVPTTSLSPCQKTSNTNVSSLHWPRRLIHHSLRFLRNQASLLNKTSCLVLPVLCVACEEARCKTSHKLKTFPQNKRCDSIYLPTNELLWRLGVKKGAPEGQKNPEIPNVLTVSCSVKDKFDYKNPQTILVQTRARWLVCGFIVDSNKNVYFLRSAHLMLIKLSGTERIYCSNVPRSTPSVGWFF